MHNAKLHNVDVPSFEFWTGRHSCTQRSYIGFDFVRLSICIITANNKIRNSCTGKDMAHKWGQVVCRQSTHRGHLVGRCCSNKPGGGRRYMCWHDNLRKSQNIYEMYKISIKKLNFDCKKLWILSHHTAQNLFRHVILCPDGSRRRLEPAEFNCSSHLAFKCV